MLAICYYESDSIKASHLAHFLLPPFGHISMRSVRIIKISVGLGIFQDADEVFVS